MKNQKSYMDCFESHMLRYDFRKHLNAIVEPPNCLQHLIRKFSKRKTVAEAVEGTRITLFVPNISQGLRFDYLVLSKITEDPLYIELFHEIAKLRNGYDGFLTWNSQLTEQFFSGIADAPMTIKSLFFVCCKLGNSLPLKLSKLDLSKIVMLKIWQDPINNQGLKQLMKLSMPELAYLQFSATYLTNDMLDLLAKRDVNILIEVVISNFSFLDVHGLFKNFVKASSQRRKDALMIRYNWNLRSVGPFLGFFAKSRLQLERHQELTYVATDEQVRPILIVTQYPIRLRKILNRGLKLFTLE